MGPLSSYPSLPRIFYFFIFFAAGNGHSSGMGSQAEGVGEVGCHRQRVPALTRGIREEGHGTGMEMNRYGIEGRHDDA